MHEKNQCSLGMLIIWDIVFDPIFPMPRLPTVTEIRLENVADCLAPTVEVLNELNDAFAPPFVQPISNTVSSLRKCVQVRRLAMKNSWANTDYARMWKRIKKNVLNCWRISTKCFTQSSTFIWGPKLQELCQLEWQSVLGNSWSMFDSPNVSLL